MSVVYLISIGPFTYSLVPPVIIFVSSSFLKLLKESYCYPHITNAHTTILIVFLYSHFTSHPSFQCYPLSFLPHQSTETSTQITISWDWQCDFWQTGTNLLEESATSILRFFQNVWSLFIKLQSITPQTTVIFTVTAVGTPLVSFSSTFQNRHILCCIQLSIYFQI